MTVPTPSISPLLIAVETALWICGLIVLWRAQFSHAARGEPQSRLIPWDVSLVEILPMAFCVITGGWLAQFIVANLSNETLGAAAHDVELWELVQGTAFQLGLLAGAMAALVLARLAKKKNTAGDGMPPEPAKSPFLAAIGTLLIALPVVTLVSYVWKTGLESLGLNVSEQDVVEIFRNVDSPAKLVVFVGLAVIVAPLTEELIFRAGLFRYLRTRVPRWLALLGPSIIFASLHVTWRTLSGLTSFLPLAVLAILFSLAYERTGRISVTIMAHSLFNLHTILLILAGVKA